MSDKENFISLSYGSVDYLIPKSDVYTAFICDSSNLLTDSEGNNKVIFLSHEIPSFNLDDVIVRDCKQESKLKTSINIPTADNKTDFNGSEYFGIITSSECRVLSASLDIFSVFSDFYGNALKEKGIVACVLNKTNFRDSRIGYLLDISKFIKKSWSL